VVEKCLQAGFFTEAFGPHQTNVVGLPFEPPEDFRKFIIRVFFRLMEEKGAFLIVDANNS
tara:strand:+ start:13385 stop:13564 length:180 start_codon:yes stop_codon:yes gene_type:complete